PFLQSRLEGTNFPTLFVKAFAENIPLQTGSVNTVVSTWTLCVVKDFEKVLQEVRRVLLPNGSLIFIEHGRAHDALTERFQNVLNPIQKKIAAGCNINRPIAKLITDSGFSLQELEEGFVSHVRTHSYTYRG